MAKAQWTPQEIAAYDQALTGVEREVDRLIQSLRIGSGEVGEEQAMASVAVMLKERSTTDLSTLLVVALRRLSHTSPESESA